MRLPRSLLSLAMTRLCYPNCMNAVMTPGPVEEVRYFGYGANRDPEMMEAILGRVPEGFPGEISGFQLCIQTWKEIPDRVKKVLAPAWGEDFQTYCVRPTAGTSRVHGVVWRLSRAERKFLDAWELTYLNWYKVFLLQYQISNNFHIQTEIPFMADSFVNRCIKGERYKTFLMGKKKILEVANNVREHLSQKPS